MVAVNYDWDEIEDNIVEEYDNAGVTVAEYSTEPSLYGNLISQNRSGVESQYHFDALGSTLALTDNNQQVTDTYAYTGFGEVTEWIGTAVNPFQYVAQTGYRRDTIVGDVGVRRRQFSPSFSRWLSPDPLWASNATKGEYVYARNQPLIYSDPSGLICELYVNCGSATSYPKRSSGSSGLMHCGLIIRHHYPGDVLPYEGIDGKGGNPNEMDNWFPDPHKGEILPKNLISIGNFPDTMCDCLRDNIPVWNAGKYRYSATYYNSNWALKCLALKCGLTIPTEGQHIGFNSVFSTKRNLIFSCYMIPIIVVTYTPCPPAFIAAPVPPKAPPVFVQPYIGPPALQVE